MSRSSDNLAKSGVVLSIVIVSWNTRELLLRCLRSLDEVLGSASKLFETETWVVDNGSADGTSAAVRELYPHVQLLELDRNVGYAAGMNLGLLRARGRAVLMLNSDTCVTKGALERGVAVLESQPGIGAAGAQLVHPDGRLQNSIHAFPGIVSELLPTVLLELLLPRRYPSKRRPVREPVEVDAVLGAALFARREAIERVGLLCEDYFFFLEDTDWCWRLHQAGLRVLHVPDARIEHVSGASSKRRHPVVTRIEFHRSLYRFLRVRRGRATLACIVSLRVAKGALSVLLLALVAPASARQRRRLRERAELFAWHLRGCPPLPSLAQVDGDDVDGGCGETA